MNYINAYIDVRARQMYEKLKELIVSGGSSEIDIRNQIFDYVRLKTNKGGGQGVVDVYVDADGTVCSNPE